MATERDNELLIGHLYGELDAGDERELRQRLEASAALRDELESLRALRRTMAEARPAVPGTTPRVVVLSPPLLRRPLLAFAAGLACAGLLLAGGVAAGWKLAPAGDVPTGGVPVAGTALPPAPTQDADVRPVTAAELHQALSDYETALDRVNRDNDELRRLLEQRTGRPVLTRDQFESELSTFVQTLDRQRASDLNYILTELADLQVSTDTRIGRTQEALRYVLLAGDPNLSEK